MGNITDIKRHLITIENGFIGLHFILGLAIVITNSLFIVTFLRSAKIRTISYAILVKLSVCDCLVGWMLIILPLKIVLDKEDNVFCYTFDIILGTFLVGSNLSIFQITFERFARISHPFFSERWITKKTVSMFFICEQCAMVIVFSITIMITYNKKSVFNVQCSMLEYASIDKKTLVYGLINCCLILSVSTIIYIHLARIARRHRKIIQVQSQASNETSLARSSTTHNSTTDRKRINMIGLILALQYISYVPFLILVVFRLWYDSPELNQPIMMTSFVGLSDFAVYSGSLCNAIIYPLRCLEIKQEIRRTLLCKP